MMVYTVPTPADIKLDFPAFADVDDAVIQRRIDRAGAIVTTDWIEGDYNYAYSLLTAHYLVLDGFGAGTESEAAAMGAAGLTRLRSGSLDVSFSETAANASVDGGYDATSYGRRFLEYLLRNRGGVRVAVAGCGGIAGQATDAPWAWRTNGFGL